MNPWLEKFMVPFSFSVHQVPEQPSMVPWPRVSEDTPSSLCFRQLSPFPLVSIEVERPLLSGEGANFILFNIISAYSRLKALNTADKKGTKKEGECRMLGNSTLVHFIGMNSRIALGPAAGVRCSPGLECPEGAAGTRCRPSS